MRTLILALLLLAGAAAATAQAPSPPPVATLEEGVARPGGVYMTLPGTTAGACADACAADGLCMAWTFLAEAPIRCELKAVIPHPVRDPLAVSGLAARAPAFARLVAPREIGPPRDLSAAPPAPEPPLPPSRAAAPPPQDAASVLPSAEEDIPEVTRDAPVLSTRAADEGPILLSADTAPLPLRDRVDGGQR